MKSRASLNDSMVWVITGLALAWLLVVSSQSPDVPGKEPVPQATPTPTATPTVTPLPSPSEQGTVYEVIGTNRITWERAEQKCKQRALRVGKNWSNVYWDAQRQQFICVMGN